MTKILEKERVLLKKINNEKKEYLDVIFEEKMYPKDIFEQISEINKYIQVELELIINKDVVDYHRISRVINKLVLYKVKFNQFLSTASFFKWKLETIKSNTKLSLMVDSYSDGVIDMPKTLLWDHTTIKMDGITWLYNAIQDINAKIKNTKDSLDSAIIALQSQLKNVTFEYINQK